MVRRLARVAAILLLQDVGSHDASAAEPFPTVRKIVVEHEDVFAPGERLNVPPLPDLTFIFDVANFIHVDTREQVVRRELLVREGDPADPRLLDESERNLRQLGFLRAVRVLTRPAGAGLVDVVVQAQDTWTTEPRLSITSGGGKQTSEFGFIERNVLGYGKALGVRHVTRIDRSADQFFWEDPRILGSRFHLRGDYQDTSDGRILEGLVEYPFFSLETPWAGGIRAATRREKNRIFSHGGAERSRFEHDERFLDVRFAHLLAGSSETFVQRLGLFYRRDEDRFARVATGLEPALVPEDRRVSEPGISYQRQVVNFVRERHFDLFDRIEDLDIGNRLQAEVGVSARPFGASSNEPILQASDRQGFDFGPGRKAFLYGLVAGRSHHGSARNSVLELEGISYQRVNLFFEQTLVTRAKLDLGRNLDRNVQLFLGSDNGLRGYSTRQLVGNKRFVFNLEDRIFFVNDLFHLLSLGAVLFFDSGYAWKEGQVVNLRDVVSSVGIGLRIGAPRAAAEKIWRFDLAIPLSTAGGKKFVPGFSFGSGQAFSAFQGPFDLQTGATR